jgi:hypothetical protein
MRGVPLVPRDVAAILSAKTKQMLPPLNRLETHPRGSYDFYVLHWERPDPPVNGCGYVTRLCLLLRSRGVLVFSTIRSLSLKPFADDVTYV